MKKIPMFKLSIDPLKQPIEDAEKTINDFFNGLALQSIHKDQEHKSKREIATNIVNNTDYEPPATFIREAELSGVSVVDLARQITGKDDEVLQRGLRRRAAVIAIRNAKSFSEIEQILFQNGLTKG